MAVGTTLCVVAGEKSEFRKFTDREGRTIHARAIAIEDDRVTLQLHKNLMIYTIKLRTLSEPDQKWVSRWRKKREQEKNQRNLTADDSEDGDEYEPDWPRKIEANDYEIEVVKEDLDSEHSVFRSRYFQFETNHKLARSVVKELAQVFESTYLAVDALPVELNPKPMTVGYFQTRIYETASQFVNDAQGNENAAAHYNRVDRMIHVPMKSLGLEKGSTSYSFAGEPKTRVLVHEITHQVMHKWLHAMPVWLTEGFATYMERVPYENGRFRFNRMDMQDLFPDKEATVWTPETLFSLTSRTWNQMLAENPLHAGKNYLSSFFYTYYFLHLDGEEEGAPMHQYLRQLEETGNHDEAVGALLQGRDFQTLQEQIQRAFDREEDIDLTFMNVH